MHRIDSPGATEANLFTEGNPSLGTPATVVSAAWLNAVQEEIAAVIEAAGIALDAEDDGQLLEALAGASGGHISGLRLANNSLDANNDIDIAAGSARDATNVATLRLAATLTKRLDAAWAVGTDQGGLDTGAQAHSTWYHVWLIQRSDTGVVDALFSTSASAPTMPADYDRKVAIGAVRTNGSGNIIGFKQRGDWFLWNIPPLDVDVTNPGTSAVLRTLSVPPGRTVEVLLNVFMATATVAGGGQDYLSSPDVTDVAGDPDAPPGLTVSIPNSSSRSFQVQCFTNTASQIRTRTNGSDGSVVRRMATVGFNDLRGRRG